MSGVGIAPIGLIFLHIVAIYGVLKLVSVLLRKPWQRDDEPEGEYVNNLWVFN